MSVDQPEHRGAFRRYVDQVFGRREKPVSPEEYAAVQADIDDFLVATDPEILSDNIAICVDMMSRGADQELLDSYLAVQAPSSIGKAVILTGATMELNRRSTENLKAAVSSLKERQSFGNQQLDQDTQRAMSQIEGILETLDQTVSDAAENMMSLVEWTRQRLEERLQSK